ncbi:helix-turn-helix domain-containing protein [Microbispora rosea]|uniref:AraC-like ligand-binding domain-containing protein n=1 Tax=Microbispora rosea TaxID=58117 RepID=UPI003433BB61
MEALVFDTEGMAVQDRFPFWYDTLSQSFMPSWVTTDHPASFYGSARMLDLGGLQLLAMSHLTVEAARPGKLIRQADPEIFQLHLVLSGKGRAIQAGRDVDFQAGQFLLIDSSRPLAGWRGADDNAAETLIVQFPRASLGLRSDMIGGLVAAPFSVRDGITSVLAGHLTRLVENAEAFTPQDAEALTAISLELIAAACAHQLEASASLSPESRRQALLSLIHDFIRQRLSDPDLTPDTIAAAHHISVRHLYKIFQEQGTTVAAWIRRCRIEQCHRDLADIRKRSLPIQTIAARWGFTDAAHFSRTFRATYGVSPREHRISAAAIGSDL